MNGLGEFQEFLRAAIDPHVGTVEGAELAAGVAIADAVDDGVSVFEMSFDIWPAPLYPDGLPGFLRFVRSLVEQCHDHIRLRPELGISRRYASNTALMDHAAEAVASAVFTSIDLYSTEDACAPEDVQPLYAQARAQGLMLKAHVGEFGSAEDGERSRCWTLTRCSIGIAVAESSDVMRWLAARGRAAQCLSDQQRDAGRGARNQAIIRSAASTTTASR